MPIYKVNSNLKHDGNFYKVGKEIELSEKEAKVLLAEGVIEVPGDDEDEVETPAAPKAPKVKKPKGAKTEVAPVKTEETKDEDDEDEDKDDAGNDDETKTVSRETTQEDLDADPALVEQGVKVGDVRDFPVVETDDADAL